MSDELEIALSMMLHAANKCDEAAGHLGSAASKTSGVEISSENAGTFSMTLEKYASVPTYVRDRVNEGVTVMQDIATVLRQAHDTYKAEDEANALTLGNQGAEL